MDIPSGWLILDKSIVKRFEFKDFNQALKFVNKVGELAEKVQHHPDIKIEYNKVTLTLTTHDQGQVTQKDLDLALKINQLKV